MKRILVIFFALTLLLLPACIEEPDIDVDGKIHTSSVISEAMAEYGDDIYLVDGKLCRYNRKTGEVYSFCQDPDCNRSCLLCSPIMRITQVVDGRLYFNAWTAWDHDNVYAYLDLVTEEVNVLLTLKGNEVAEVSPPVLDGGWLYFTGQILRENGDATNPDDYQPYIGRIPMDGGESEVVCHIEDSNEILHAVIEGNAITRLSHQFFYSTNLETNERKTLFDPEEYGFQRFVDKINYLNGYFYLLVGSSESFQSEYYPGSFRKFYLVKVDAQTGDMTQLVDEPVYGLVITDDAIYYTEQTIRPIYVPEDYADHPEKVVVTGSYETIFSCDLDGNNRKEIYSDPYLDVNFLNRIIDNCLYGWIHVYDEDNHTMGKSFFAKVDLATGEITPAIQEK